ncbi:hypothetical protein C0991_001559 [Blastosporella zonata]|nr:hypothetical protein C0991_001559 [Blastosporella zonata]
MVKTKNVPQFADFVKEFQRFHIVEIALYEQISDVEYFIVTVEDVKRYYFISQEVFIGNPGAYDVEIVFRHIRAARKHFSDFLLGTLPAPAMFFYQTMIVADSVRRSYEPLSYNYSFVGLIMRLRETIDEIAAASKSDYEADVQRFEKKVASVKKAAISNDFSCQLFRDKMAKGGGKSSATSGTRKKHAKKAAGPSHEEQAAPIPKDLKKLTKQQRSQKKKEPRVKAYIPPVKPAPVQPDPLETTGLAHSLPPDLLIVLRSFNKKAQVTKIRALEELQAGWIDKCRKEGEDGALVYVLIDMLPVWLHHVPALFVHPSRRVRLLAAAVHLSFVQISPIRDQLLSFLRDSASPSQIESILGTWYLAAHDIEKSVASTALKSWTDVITFASGPRDQLLLDDHYLPSLITFIQRATLDPNGIYMYLNPPPPAAPAPPTKKGVRKEEPEPPRSKAEELEESDTDRKARLRIGGLGAIRRIVGKIALQTLHASLPDDLVNFFNNPALWSSLYHADQCPFVGVESFGYGQHNVRKSAWALILSLLSAPKTQVESLLPLLSVATLRSAWVESDTTVHTVMWQPLLKFLKEFPRAWEIERVHDYSRDENGDEDSDSESSDVEAEKPPAPDAATKPSAAYQEFLHFLELGCSGTPLQGYPTVVIVVSTISSSANHHLLSPGDIFEMVLQRPPGITFNLPHDIFPSMQEIDKILDELSPDPIHPSLAVIQPLIPPASAFTEPARTSTMFDQRGFSTYARIVDALLQVFIEDRQIAKNNLWAIRHFQALELYVQDFISIPSAKSEVFAAEAIHASLETLVSRVEQVTTYILTSSTNERWRETALAAALDNRPSTSSGTLTAFLGDIIQRSRTSDNLRDSRILRNILQHVFRDVEKDEADRWMQLARKVEATAPETSMVIVFAVTNFAPEPLRLDRYRNELAASLLGIPPAKANVEGLLTLRKLCASAPNPESDVVFLPQPRAVNITKACQQWITSDEDIDEEVVSAITAIFYHLAPILQDISGAHWEFAYDIMENNLEGSSLTDDTTLGTLARTLRLVTLMQDLCSTNKSLRAEWEERKMPILTMVRDLATVSLGIILAISDLLKMCHLVTDSSVEVQKMAYRFLVIAAKKRTEFLVIEAGVDSEGAVNMDLSESLLNILQRSTALEDISLESPNVFGYLLGWMLLFDLFHESSLKVRSSYIEQLRNLDVIVAYFIPTILNLLRLDQGPHKAFKLDIWAVDEFHVEYYETGSNFSLPVLAAHLYYRALLTVPSLIHTWVTDCKDRQLSSSITNYTSQCFSPVIIRTELTHVRSPESTSLLVDENFTIKVASSVNEVVASYSVDEHQLEIKLKIPTDWPLHKIEIKDLKRVGVDENRWRAWILAVQQIIWSHVCLFAIPHPVSLPDERIT